MESDDRVENTQTVHLDLEDKENEHTYRFIVVSLFAYRRRKTNIPVCLAVTRHHEVGAVPG